MQPPIVDGSNLRQYAVTFIDNHDTGSTQRHWPFPDDKVRHGIYLLGLRYQGPNREDTPIIAVTQRISKGIGGIWGHLGKLSQGLDWLRLHPDASWKLVRNIVDNRR